MGEVIPFGHVPTCFLCVHSGFDAIGATYCRMFDERIESEIFAARHCGSYEVQ